MRRFSILVVMLIVGWLLAGVPTARAGGGAPFTASASVSSDADGDDPQEIGRDFTDHFIESVSSDDVDPQGGAQHGDAFQATVLGLSGAGELHSIDTSGRATATSRADEAIDNAEGASVLDVTVNTTAATDLHVSGNMSADESGGEDCAGASLTISGPDGSETFQVVANEAAQPCAASGAPSDLSVSEEIALDTPGSVTISVAATAETDPIEDTGESEASAKFNFSIVLASCTNEFTDGDDQIMGTGGDDVLCGGGGNDTITGFDGNDEIFGDAGNDDVNAGLNNDVVHLGSGDDGAGLLEGV